MDYNLTFALVFKCIFLLWFHFDVFYRESIINDRKINMDWRELQQKLSPTINHGLLND
jgi:hypothetical protein